MKKLVLILLAGCMLVFALTACGGGDTPASSSEPAPASSDAPAGSSDAADSMPDDSTAPAPYDVNELLATLVEAANLGTTISVDEIDLTAGGINADNIEAFAGASSQLYSENGGIVLVIQAKPGMAGTVAAEVESFRESRMDDRYTEFATQVANTGDGRVAVNGDYVIFAVSATGHEGGWDQLDAAIEGLFA